MKARNVILVATSSTLSAAVRVHVESSHELRVGIHSGQASSGRALYFLDTNPNGTAIVALGIAENGTLYGEPMVTPTGGRGLVGVNGTGHPVAFDPIFSQDSIVVNGNRLFAVNPGSNTLSLFHIPRDNPLGPQLISEASSGGDIPNSVAFSEKHNMACVVNTGNMSGVQCFDVDHCDELQRRGTLMPLPLNVTAPPLSILKTASDIVFSPDEETLFVSAKGDGMGPGSFYAYSVADIRSDRGTPAAVVSSPGQVMLAFSLTFVSNKSAFVTDPTSGTWKISVDDRKRVSVAANISMPGELACWSVYSPAHHSVYILAGNSPNVTVLDSASGNVTGIIPGDMRSRGSFDSIADRSSLYVLQGSRAVAVFDMDGSRLVQYFDKMDGVADRSGWIGMALYSG